MSYTGIVLFFNEAKVYGFIGRKRAGYDNVYVHASQVVGGLMRGDVVQFDVGFDEVRGKQYAMNVTGGTCIFRDGKGGGKGKASSTVARSEDAAAARGAEEVAADAAASASTEDAAATRGAEEAAVDSGVSKWNDWTPSIGSGNSIRSEDASFDDSASLRVLGRLEGRYWRRRRLSSSSSWHARLVSWSWRQSSGNDTWSWSWQDGTWSWSCDPWR